MVGETDPKYPRTYHLPFSAGVTSDDKISRDVSKLIGNEIVITEKLDGGNCCITRSGVHARSHASVPKHPSFDHIKSLHANIGYQIDVGIQIFGENLWARHSIEYSELPAYFLVFGVRDLENGSWMGWDDVALYSQLLGLQTVPVLFRGTVNSEKTLQKIVTELATQPSACGGQREGCVVRFVDKFADVDFAKCCQKWVRKNHVDPNNDHWMHQELIKNKLKDK